MKGKGLGRILLMIVGWGLLGGALASGAAESAGSDAGAAKPGIILVAFGTSIPEAQAVFAEILKSAQARYPGYDIVYGFTARSIVQKLREEKRDNGVLTLEEALAEMKKRGHTSVALQSLHVVPGQKDAEIPAAVQKAGEGLRAAYGAPLLSSDADLAAALAALSGLIAKDGPTVICGHGNDRHPEYNAQLMKFDQLLRAKYPGTVLCSVEGKPGTAALETEVKPAVQKAGGKVTFVPLMIVAGDHILNDVSGDDKESWKSLLGASAVTVARPLGHQEEIRALFWRHLDAALQSLAVPAGAAAK